MPNSGLRVDGLSKRTSFLLWLLSGVALTAWSSAVEAQEAQQPLLRGLDQGIDGPPPARKRGANAVKVKDGTEAHDPMHGLRDRPIRSVVVSKKIKAPKPQDIRPNPAVLAPAKPDAVPPGLAPIPVKQPVRARQDDPYAPVGTRIGSFRLNLNNEVQGGYDDNTARATGDQARRPSYYVREGGELRLRSDWSQHELSAEASGGYSWYPSAKEANRPDLNSRLGLRLDMSRDTQINFETRGKIDTQSPNSADLQLTPAERPLVYNYGASAGVTQRYDRLVFDLRGSIDRSTYDAAKLSDGSSLDQSTRNLNDYAMNLRVGYELKPGLTPFVEGNVDTRQYDKTFDDTGYQRSSNGGTVKVGTSFEITRLVTGTVSAGYGNRTYDDARLQDLRGPIADASIVWAATPLTTVTLRGASSFDETTIVGSSGAIARRVSLDLNHQLLRNLAVGANIAWTDTKYDGVNRRDDVVTGTLRAEYRLDRRWAARLSYTYERSLSNVLQSGYVSNIWMLGIKADL